MRDAGARSIAFVGLGSMGWPMAANLLRAGFQVSGIDAVPSRARRFADEVGGPAPVEMPEAVAQASFVVTMLPTSADVADVVRKNVDAFRPGSLVMDMSSGTPRVTLELASELAGRGVGLIDCPVSGGVRRAEAGELAIMVGGPEDLLDRARPLLDVVGASVKHCGGVGSGQAMKSLNNLVSAGGFLIGIEALVIGKAYGLDTELMVDVLNSSSGMNYSTQEKFKQYVLSRSFDSGFGLDLMVKDLGVAVDVARDHGVVSPFAALCFQLWSAAGVQFGPGRGDYTQLAQFIEDIAGVKLSADESPHRD